MLVWLTIMPLSYPIMLYATCIVVNRTLRTVVGFIILSDLMTIVEEQVWIICNNDNNTNNFAVSACV